MCPSDEWNKVDNLHVLKRSLMGIKQIVNCKLYTSATILISQNVDPSTVSKRLGHSRTSTIMDIYSHRLEKSDKVAADKLENLFNKKEQNIKQE